MMARHDDREARAFAVAVEKHLAPMGPTRAMSHREAEARATGLRREERIEEAIANVAGDAWSVVAYANCNALLAHVGMRRGFVIERSSFNSDLAFRRRSLNGVEREVEHGTVQKVLV